MAILNDLAKETSFRRFYLRWLAACWVPALFVTLPFAILAMDLWFKLYRASFVLFPVSNLALPVFWLLVALGQSWFLRRYSLMSRRWAVTVVLAGVAASFALFLVAGLTFIPSTGILFAFLVMASTVTGLLDPNPWLMAAGGALFGLILSSVVSTMVAAPLRLRGLWIGAMTLAGLVVFLLLWPLCEMQIKAWAMVRFAPNSPFAVIFGAMVGAPTGILLTGWLLWSASAGIALWWLRALQAQRDLGGAQRIFD